MSVQDFKVRPTVNGTNVVAAQDFDAKGDILLGTANDTYARQAAGTDGQFLMADSTQTNGVRWQSNNLGYVDHGSTAGTARPTGFGKVIWYGSVTPTNAIDGDIWIDTT